MTAKSLSVSPSPGGGLPARALLISGLGVVLSLVFSFLIFPHLREPLNLNIDPDKCGELASNIFRGEGYVYDGSAAPALDRGPVYPFLVAGVFLLSGDDTYAGVQVVQALAHGLTALVVFLIAVQISDRRTASLAAMLCAVHPMLVWYTARVWIETIHTLVVALALFAAVLLVQKPSQMRALIAGVLFGIATLTKSVILFFPVALAVYLLVRERSGGWKVALTLILLTLAVVAPWTVRNYHTSGSFVPVHTSLGLNLIQGDAIGTHWSDAPFSTLTLWHHGKAEMDSILAGSGHTATDAVGDRLLVRASVSANLSDPVALARRIAINAITFWYLSESPLKSGFLLLIQVPLLAALLLFGFRLWKEEPVFLPILLLIAYYAVLHALVVGWARYSVPILPACLLVVAEGWMRGRRTG